MMIILMLPILMIPNYKNLSAFSSFFVFCCITSIICIFLIELDTIFKRSQGESVKMTYSEETGKILLASDEKLATAFDYEYFNYTLLPIFMGEVMSIFEGNAGILNIYSQ